MLLIRYFYELRFKALPTDIKRKILQYDAILLLYYHYDAVFLLCLISLKNRFIIIFSARLYTTFILTIFVHDQTFIIYSIGREVNLVNHNTATLNNTSPLIMLD